MEWACWQYLCYRSLVSELAILTELRTNSRIEYI